MDPPQHTPPKDVPMKLDLVNGDYAQFIRDIRDVLAEHESPNMVAGHPVLPKQNRGIPPMRWINIELMVNESKTTTLAVRDDNLYLIGFKAQNGRWYEFGYEPCKDGCVRHTDTKCVSGSSHMLNKNPFPTFLECDVTYASLLDVTVSGSKRNKQVRKEMVQLQLGKNSAIEAVGTLSSYNQAEDGGIDRVTKLALVRLILMFCEATRMIPIFHTVRSRWDDDNKDEDDDTAVSSYFINMNKSVYMFNWAIMSGALLGWQEGNPKYNYWGPNDLTGLTEHYPDLKDQPINISYAGEALDIVHVLLKSDIGKDESKAHLRRQKKSLTGNKHIEDKNDGSEKSGDGSVQPEGSDIDPQASAPPALSASEDSNKQVQLSMVGYGRPLVEVIGVRAYSGFVVGTIAVFDGRRGQILYKRHAHIHYSASQSEDVLDLALTGPYRAISAGGSFAIQVDGVFISDESREVSGDFLWDCFTNKTGYDKALRDNITIGPFSIAEVTYAVLSDAVEATVQVHLKLDGQCVAGATTRVHGEITAKNQHFEDKRVQLFLHAEGEAMELQVLSSADGLGVIRLPLARSVVAAPVDLPLQIEVKVYVAFSPNNESILFFHEYMDFPLSEEHTGKMERNGVVVQVTSPHIYALPEKRIQRSYEKDMATGDVLLKFDLNVDDYAEFMHNFHRMLAEHDFPEEVAPGHPVLAKQQSPKTPKRWIYIKLVGYNDDTTTLAVRDDNLYLVGFQAQNQTWYEFGMSRELSVSTMGNKQTSFLGWDFRYKDLHHPEVRRELVDLKLGKGSAITAVGIISRYNQKEGVVVDTTTRRALTCLILMFCEATRMRPVFNTVQNSWHGTTGGQINVEQLRCMWNWGNMSTTLLNWKQNGSWEVNDQLRRFQIESAEQVLGYVQVVLNTKQLLLSGFGQPLVEIISMHADPRDVGTISVFDGRRGQIIYKHHSPIHGSSSQGTSDLALTGPHRAISAAGSFTIEVDGIPTANASEESGGNMFWDCYSETFEYNRVYIHDIRTRTGSVVKVHYAVLNDAFEATVQVDLKLNGVTASGTTARVYGKITARDERYRGRSVLLFSRTEEEETRLDVLRTSDGLSYITIPLARSVVAAAPFGSKLVINVKLHVAYSSENAVSCDGDVLFPIFGGKHTKEIKTAGLEAEVKVSIPWKI